jgi:hypothetical protein
MDVIYVSQREEYWILFCAPGGSGSGLYFAKSRDRLTWRLNTEVLLNPSENGWDDKKIYRPTLLHDSFNQLLRVWYSAQSTGYEWHVGYTQTEY